MDKFRAQSLRFGTTIITETVSRIDLSARPFRYWREGQEDQEAETADAVIIATGASAKRMGLKGEDTYWQSGISACAVCDGAVPIFRNKPLAVIGGGDSAAEEATCKSQRMQLPPLSHDCFFSIDLTKYGSHVYVIVRRGELRASKIMAKRLMNNSKIVSRPPCTSLQLCPTSRVIFNTFNLPNPQKPVSHTIFFYSRLSFGTPLQSNAKAMATSSITSASRTC